MPGFQVIAPDDVPAYNAEMAALVTCAPHCNCSECCKKRADIAKKYVDRFDAAKLFKGD